MEPCNSGRARAEHSWRDTDSARGRNSGGGSASPPGGGSGYLTRSWPPHLQKLEETIKGDELEQLQKSY